ncbi:patatin-like phospholipase family protein [Phycicoccus avicenniae]|uniref:patatin-like phospholipase family protein n=1 Tax=Phycicoccus avicenniae TaxID=2828860 RepID=UPI003D28C1A4
MTRSALVLGGGGITGIAWELGLLHGLAEAGVDLTTADLVVGTSAGSVAGAQIRSGTPLAELYDAQLAPPEGEIGATLSRWTMLRLLPAVVRPGSAHQKRARVGRKALRAHPGDGAERVAVIRHRVPWEHWPSADLRITAVDARTGEFVVLDRDGGVDLVHAVAASCAVPMVWPPVAVGDRHYVDGGVRSTTNADVAEGCDPVVVIAPLPRSLTKASSIEAQLARTGARSTAVVAPDARALAAIGKNVLDPARRADAARAGRRQAAQVLREVETAWSSGPRG